jgi:hypothetical protein
VSQMTQKNYRLFISAAAVCISAFVGSCYSRVCPWATNSLRLKAFGGALLYESALKEELSNARLPQHIFEIDEYDDTMKFVDPTSGRLYDWLYFPNGLDAGEGQIIIAASPTTFDYRGKECRIVLLGDSTVHIIPVNEFNAISSSVKGKRVTH